MMAAEKRKFETEGGFRPLERLYRFLDKLVQGGFFGRVILTFQSGKLCDIKIEENKKLDEL